MQRWFGRVQQQYKVTATNLNVVKHADGTIPLRSCDEKCFYCKEIEKENIYDLKWSIEIFK